MSLLHDKVTYLYRQYTENSSYILPRHEHLFTQRSLENRLQMSYDSIQCWIRSGEDARHILDFQQHHLQATAATMFQLFRSSPTQEVTSEIDSSYTPPRQQYFLFHPHPMPKPQIQILSQIGLHLLPSPVGALCPILHAPQHHRR
jgi:hypothetical protein